MQDDAIVVVSGLPRSGTSMMMRMLEAGGVPALADHERQADADNPKGYYELEAVKAMDEGADWLDRAGGQAVKVIYKLVYDLPADRPYKVIFLERDLAEVVASQEAMLARMGQDPGPLERDTVIELFQAEVFAFRKWAEAQRHLEMFYIPYAEAVADPRATAERLADFLDRPLDAEAMAATVDPSLYRQRA